MKQQRFHLSLPSSDTQRTKTFYRDVLGCKIGREAHNWVDVNLYGNQLTFIDTGAYRIPEHSYSLQGKQLPIFHFGVVLEEKDWNAAMDKIEVSGYELDDPIIFLEGKVGEHVSFFVDDPNDYRIEFKYFTSAEQVFKKD